MNPVSIWGVSRAISLGACAASSILIPHHDLSYELLNDTSRLMFLIRWDAIFFYRISRDGYMTDSMTAFFPLYPMLIRMLFYCGVPIVAAGAIISNLSFLVSAVLLYALTERYLGKDRAQKACFLFCFSPCSILYSTLYTESIFTMFVLLAVREALLQRAWSVLWISLASAVRSNGFILAPIAFVGLLGRYSLISSVFLSLVPLGVFAAIQWYWWLYRFPEISILPYSYIQSKYWEQGFMEFYRHAKNIPNFLVGAPFVSLSLWILWVYFKREKETLSSLCRSACRAGKDVVWEKIKMLGTLNQTRRKNRSDGKGKVEIFRDLSVTEVSEKKSPIRKEEKRRPISTDARYYLIRLFLQCVLLFQVVLSVFFIHMNMHFRFVAYNPVVYWELSEIFQKRGIGRVVMFGYVCFSFVYAVLYGAYFPPA